MSMPRSIFIPIYVYKNARVGHHQLSDFASHPIDFKRLVHNINHRPVGCVDKYDAFKLGRRFAYDSIRKTDGDYIDLRTFDLEPDYDYIFTVQLAVNPYDLGPTEIHQKSGFEPSKGRVIRNIYYNELVSEIDISNIIGVYNDHHIEKEMFYPGPGYLKYQNAIRRAQKLESFFTYPIYENAKLDDAIRLALKIAENLNKWYIWNGKKKADLIYDALGRVHTDILEGNSDHSNLDVQDVLAHSAPDCVSIHQALNWHRHFTNFQTNRSQTKSTQTFHAGFFKKKVDAGLSAVEANENDTLLPKRKS